MQDLEKRVTKTEYVLGDHAEQLQELHKDLGAFEGTLGGIEKTLLQIKWIAVGALLMVALSDGTIGAKLLRILG
jgi:hypothetical protein|tara:strand:+ start:409 stop:630 length:222 start_codon:yes stop_codon:yes gene_type:complete